MRDILRRRQSYVEYGGQKLGRKGGTKGFEVEFFSKPMHRNNIKIGSHFLAISRNLETIPRLRVQLWSTMNKQTRLKKTSRMQGSEGALYYVVRKG